MVRKRKEGPKAKANETLFLKTKMCRRQLIVSRREKSSMMNKMIKKISAVALAAAMTLSTGVAAQAATLKVYFRENQLLLLMELNQYLKFPESKLI